MHTVELMNLSFVNKMLVLAEVMQEPKAEYLITLHNGQIHVERVDGEPEEDEYIVHGLSVIHALGGGHADETGFHDISIFQTGTHWKVAGTSYVRGCRFLLDAGYQGKDYVTFEMEGRPLVFKEVEEWVVDHAIKLCEEYGEGSITEDRVITPYCQFRKENGIWRKYE